MSGAGFIASLGQGFHKSFQKTHNEQIERRKESSVSRKEKMN
jgi:hypothetical protein